MGPWVAVGLVEPVESPEHRHLARAPVPFSRDACATSDASDLLHDTAPPWHNRAPCGCVASAQHDGAVHERRDHPHGDVPEERGDLVPRLGVLVVDHEAVQEPSVVGVVHRVPSRAAHLDARDVDVVVHHRVVQVGKSFDVPSCSVIRAGGRLGDDPPARAAKGTGPPTRLASFQRPDVPDANVLYWIGVAALRAPDDVLWGCGPLSNGCPRRMQLGQYPHGQMLGTHEVRAGASLVADDAWSTASAVDARHRRVSGELPLRREATCGHA